MKWLAPLLALVLLFARPEATSSDDRRYLFGVACGPYPAVCWQQAPDYVQPAQLALRNEWPPRICYVYEGGRDVWNEMESALYDLYSISGIGWVYDCTSPHITVFATAGSAYNYGSSGHFGCGIGSIGCLPEYGRNLKVVVDAGAMANWGSLDVAAVFKHEFGHVYADAGEMYAHTGGTIGCKTPVVPTVMSCGITNSRFYTAFDAETVAIFHDPPKLARCWVEVDPGAGIPCVGMTVNGDGSGGVWWCNVSKVASHVSLSSDQGYIGTIYNPIKAPNCQGVSVAFQPGQCYYLVEATSLSWYSGKSEYQLAGCR